MHIDVYEQLNGVLVVEWGRSTPDYLMYAMHIFTIIFILGLPSFNVEYIYWCIYLFTGANELNIENLKIVKTCATPNA